MYRYLLVTAISLAIVLPGAAGQTIPDQKQLFNDNEKMILVYFTSIDLSVRSRDHANALTKAKKAESLLEDMQKLSANIIDSLKSSSLSKTKQSAEIASYTERLKLLTKKLEQAYSDASLLAVNNHGRMAYTLDTSYENNNRFKRSGTTSETIFGSFKAVLPIEAGKISFTDSFNRWRDTNAQPQNHNLSLNVDKQIREELSSAYYLRFSPHRDTKNTISYTDDLASGLTLKSKIFGNGDFVLREDYGRKRFLRNQPAGYYTNRLGASIRKPVSRHTLNLSADANQATTNKEYSASARFTQKVSDKLSITYANRLQVKHFTTTTSQKFRKNDLSLGIKRLFSGAARLSITGGLTADRRPISTADSERITRLSGSWSDRLSPAFNYQCTADYLKRNVNTSTRDYDRRSAGLRGQLRLWGRHLFSIAPKQVTALYDQSASTYQEQTINASWEVRLFNSQRLKCAHKFLHHRRVHDTVRSYDKKITDLSWDLAVRSALSLRLGTGYEQYLPQQSTSVHSAYDAVTASGRCAWNITDRWEIEGSVRYWDRSTDKNNTGDAGSVTSSARLQYHF